MSNVDFIFTAPKQGFFKRIVKGLTTGSHIPWAEKQALKKALKEEGFDTVSFVKKKRHSNEFTVTVTHTKDDSAFAACVKKVRDKLEGYKTSFYSEEATATAIGAKLTTGDFTQVTGMFSNTGGGIRVIQ